jgi:hypothetical protein
MIKYTLLFALLLLVSACGTEHVINEDEESSSSKNSSSSAIAGGGKSSSGGSSFSSSSFSSSSSGSSSSSSDGSDINTTREKAMLVTVGNSSSHAISQNGEHWFSFQGTGETFIFETTGDVVDTYIAIYTENQGYSTYSNDNGGEGYNALCSLNTIPGTTYFIRITSNNYTSGYSPSGTYTFVVTLSTTNARANSIPLTVEYSASHTISSGGQHWFSFQGTGESVIFETEGNVVETGIELYIENNTSAILTDKKRISFSTALETTYYIKITGNSGTYAFNVNKGIGDGTSKSYAIPVTEGYLFSHTISKDSEHWFSFQGTGETFIFETTGDVVDTYISIYTGNQGYSTGSNDNGGEDVNALYSLNTVSGTTYFIRITSNNNTSGYSPSGTYTFVVTLSTTNAKANSIPLTVEYSASHTISSGGQHWFSFQGTGESVIFETVGNVVATEIELYIENNTSAILTDKKRISFSTALETTYYIKITGNSGTYAFNVYNGIGDGSFRSYAIPVIVGYSFLHTIIRDGQHWFSFQGTGESVIFETTGDVVDTYIAIYTGNQGYTTGSNDNGGEGVNALYSLNTVSGTTYFIRITSNNNTSGYSPSGIYTFVVRQ